MIVQPEQLGAVREQHENEQIALVHGVFDIVHPGHVERLQVARNLADIVVVAVCGDENVRARKGCDRPVNGAGQRMQVIDAFRPVSYTFELAGIGWPEEIIEPHLRELQPDVYLLSSAKQQPFGDAGLREHPNGRVTTAVYDTTYAAKIHSTTGIIARLNGHELLAER